MEPIDHKHRVCIFLDGRITSGVRSVGSNELGRQGTCNKHVAHSRKHGSSGNATVRCIIVEQNNCQQYTDNEC